jgi:hypothetical protein
MNLPKYKDVLKMTKEKIDETLAPVRAKQAQKKAELEVAEMEEKVLTLETEIYELCAKHPIPFSDIIDKQDEVALFERKIEQFSKIVEQLFGE